MEGKNGQIAPCLPSRYCSVEIFVPYRLWCVHFILPRTNNKNDENNRPRANPAPMFGQQSRREGLEPPEDPPEEMGDGRSFGRLPDDGRVPPSYSGNSDNDDIDLVISVDDGEDYTAASLGYTEDGAHTYDAVSPRSGQYYGEEQEDYSHDGESQFTGQYTSESRGDQEYDPSPGPPVSSVTRGPNHFFHKSRERRLLMSSHGFGGRRYGAKLSESNSDPTVEGIGSSLKNDTDGSSMIDAVSYTHLTLPTILLV